MLLRVTSLFNLQEVNPKVFLHIDIPDTRSSESRPNSPLEQQASNATSTCQHLIVAEKQTQWKTRADV